MKGNGLVDQGECHTRNVEPAAADEVSKATPMRLVCLGETTSSTPLTYITRALTDVVHALNRSVNCARLGEDASSRRPFFPPHEFCPLRPLLKSRRWGLASSSWAFEL